MRAVTLRRVIVFGVCALGVGALYLAPSMARSPDQVGSPPRAQDQPTPRPRVEVTKTATVAPASSAPRITSVARPGRVLASATRSEAVDEPAEEPSDEESAAPTKRATPKTVRSGATAVDPNRTVDDIAPAAVPQIFLSAVTPDAFTVGWDAAEDNVGVVSYQVWLNGFLVATTEKLEVSVNWFNDDASQHVVQVRAVDAAGNQSTGTPTVMATRPESIVPTVTLSPTPNATPTATPTPSVLPTPSAPRSDQATKPTDQPTEPTDQPTEPTAQSTASPASPDPGDPSDEGAEDADKQN